MMEGWFHKLGKGLQGTLGGGGRGRGGGGGAKNSQGFPGKNQGVPRSKEDFKK